MIDDVSRHLRIPNKAIAASDLLNRRGFVVTMAAALGLVVWRPSVAFAADPETVTILRFSPTGKPLGKASVPKVVRSDAEWKHKLTPISFSVARHAGTEIPFSGKTWNNHERGLYRCVCCDNALFSSETKFESGTGWPSFWQPIAKENVVETSDTSLGEVRTAVSCRECDAHLGHVFKDGPRPTGLRYCMNSAAMHFVKTT